MFHVCKYILVALHSWLNNFLEKQTPYFIHEVVPLIVLKKANFSGFPTP